MITPGLVNKHYTQLKNISQNYFLKYSDCELTFKCTFIVDYNPEQLLNSFTQIYLNVINIQTRDNSFQCF